MLCVSYNNTIDGLFKIKRRNRKRGVYIHMKADQLYQELKNLAEKLGIKVMEKNLNTPGIQVKSGLCKVKGEDIYLMDKNLPLHMKNQLLASCLNKASRDDIYIIPAVREFIDKHNG